MPHAACSRAKGRVEIIGRPTQLKRLFPSALHFGCATAAPQAHQIGGASRVLVPAAHTWDPCIGDITSTLASRGLVCLAPRGMIVQGFGEALTKSGATHCCTTPSLLALLGEENAASSRPRFRLDDALPHSHFR